MINSREELASFSEKAEKEIELLIQEWKEARVSIARFDTISVDLRKYGFSLTTFLITAYSIVFQIANLNNPLPVVVAPFAIMILVCGLFLADRYNEVLLLSSVLRCRQLEDTSHEMFERYIQSNFYIRMNLTTFIENRVQQAKARPFSLMIYFLFIVACLSLGIVFLLAYYQQTQFSPSPIYFSIIAFQGFISLAFVFVVNRNMADLISSILDEVIIDDRIVIRKLFSEDKIERKVKELATQIHRHYTDDNFTILTIGIGGLHFAQRIISELKRLGRINIPSVALFTERVRESETDIKTRIEPPEKHLISDRHIIIVDDLVSTGYTLQSAQKICTELEAKTIHACILLDAPAKRKVEKLEIYFHGLTTPEKGDFVGCGMDIEGECRDLTFIGIAKSYSPQRLK
jgi:hypoxanthine phosphoribosyltransferase